MHLQISAFGMTWMVLDLVTGISIEDEDRFTGVELFVFCVFKSLDKLNVEGDGVKIIWVGIIEAVDGIPFRTLRDERVFWRCITESIVFEWFALCDGVLYWKSLLHDTTNRTYCGFILKSKQRENNLFYCVKCD